MPAPKRQFSRPSINLGGGPKKEWQEVAVSKLSEGDNVRGWGTVKTIALTEGTVFILWQSGATSVLLPDDQVTAFTAV